MRARASSISSTAERVADHLGPSLGRKFDAGMVEIGLDEGIFYF
jgi:hypothetical protein